MIDKHSERLVAVAVVALVLLAGCPVSIGTSPRTSDDPASPVTAPSSQPADTAARSEQRSSNPRSPCETVGAPETNPTASASSTATSADSTPIPVPEDGPSGYTIPVRGNGSLPFDANKTYARTLALLDVDTEPPAQLYLQETETPWRPSIQDPFARALVDARETNSRNIETRTGITLSNVENQTPLQLRYTLVHEYVHHLQFQRVDDSTAFRAMESGRDGVHGDAAFAIVEGSASYVALEYMRTYTDHTKAEIVHEVDEYRNASPAGKYVWGPYHFGRQYADARVDSPAEHWKLYENPPRTTEELIHALEPGSEPVTPLSVSLHASDWSLSDRTSRGELFVRTTLSAELSEQRAAQYAAGWGNDEVLHVDTGNETGYAWALRWDTTNAADDFVRGFCATMDRRSDRSGGFWSPEEDAVDIRRVAPETTVVLAGPETFVRAVTVDGENGTVRVDRQK